MTQSPESERTAAHHFGKLLVKRQRTFQDIRWQIYASLGVIALGILSLVAVVVAVIGKLAEPEDVAAVPGLVFFAICGAIGFILYLWYSLYTQLCCYEQGIVRSTLLGTRELNFADLDAMAFSKRRQYTHHGLYVGTCYFLMLQPRPETRRSSLSFNTQVYQGVEAEMESMRDHIADLLAETMQAELDRQGTVFWTPLMRIGKEGVECDVNRQWRLVPWANLQLVLEDDDWLTVYDDRTPQPVIRVGQICVNFYPGLLLAMNKLAEIA